MPNYEYAVTVKVKDPDEDVALSRSVKGEYDSVDHIGSVDLAQEILKEAVTTFESNLRREKQQQKLPE